MFPRSISLLVLALLTPLLVAQEHPKRNEFPRELTIRLASNVQMEFARIEAGEFLMGSPDTDVHAQIYEKPQRRVKITKPFYLGKFEVTKAQFRVFADETKYLTNEEKSQEPHRTWRNEFVIATTDQHPVVWVSWFDARAFCDWLAKHARAKAAGVTMARLPTEAEWEYACRAGTTGRRFFGDNVKDLAKYANVGDRSLQRLDKFFRNPAPWDDGYPYTALVGKFEPNPWGLYDMYGNVNEWCEDYYRDSYKDMDTIDPVCSKTQGGRHHRVIRGGGWMNKEGICSSTYRGLRAAGDVTVHASNDVGFRVLLRIE